MQQVPASVLVADRAHLLNQVPDEQFTFCATGTGSDAGGCTGSVSRTTADSWELVHYAASASSDAGC